MLVAIEGIDGCGKGTQAALLAERLTATGLRTEMLSFPRYSETHFGQAVGRFLNGQFGQLDEVHPQLVSLLYAGDRFESRDVIHTILSESDVLVCDRYVPSNCAHQGAKLDGEERDSLVGWIEQIEYDVYHLPRPDLVILLDMPVEQAQRLVALKAQRTYTERVADIQEEDGRYLARVRNQYLQLAESPNWRTVTCRYGESVRSIDSVADEIWACVARHLPRNSSTVPPRALD